MSPGSPKCPGPRGREGRSHAESLSPRCSSLGPSDPAGQMWTIRVRPGEGQRPPGATQRCQDGPSASAPHPGVTQLRQDGPIGQRPPGSHSSLRTGLSAPHPGVTQLTQNGPVCPPPSVTQLTQDGPISQRPPGPHSPLRRIRKYGSSFVNSRMEWKEEQFQEKGGFLLRIRGVQ